MQNPEPSVDFDTVANVKQQHDVNVGKTSINDSFNLHEKVVLVSISSIILTKLFMVQQFRIPSDLADTTLSSHFLLSNHESLVTSLVLHLLGKIDLVSLESHLFIGCQGCFNLVTFIEPICNSYCCNNFKLLYFMRRLII